MTNKKILMLLCFSVVAFLISNFAYSLTMSKPSTGESFTAFILNRNNQSGFACAHSKLPLGTVVEITSVDETNAREEVVEFPADGSAINISSPFGNRSCSGCSSFHEGIDILGQDAIAALDGRVSKASWGNGFGKTIVIDHFDEDGNVHMTTLYAHLSRFYVKVGDMVSKGQKIGKIGNTGKSFGAHLHFEISDSSNGGYTSHVLSTKRDPMQYLNGDKTVIVADVVEKTTTCSIRNRTEIGENMIEVPRTVARKVGAEKDPVKEVQVTVLLTPE